MRLNELRDKDGANKKKIRVGRGIGSGKGKTGGRGVKGQKSRSGGGVRPGFEGGQMPLHRRLPKKGFNNTKFQDKVAVVNVANLNARFEDGATVTEATLREAGLVSGPCDAVKVLGNGDLEKKLTVTVNAVSASAKEKIEKAGGTVEQIA